jgi:hypothetical protein
MASLAALVLLGVSYSSLLADDSSIWVNAEYLLWFQTRGPLAAPLVTTGPSGNPNAGVLDEPTTQILVGGPQSFGAFSGIRATVGSWLDEDCTLAAEISGFLLERRSAGFRQVTSTQNPPELTIPLLDVAGNVPSESGYGVSGTSIAVNAAGSVVYGYTNRLWGWEANGLLKASESEQLTVLLLGGFRQLNLEETLRLGTISQEATPGLDLTLRTNDTFGTQNRFYGAQLGTRVGYWADRFLVELTGKVALGWMAQSLSIRGLSSQSGANAFAPGPFSSGLFAQETNVGSYQRDRFAVVPEASLRVGYCVTENLRASLGYNALYISDVLRAGSQIDRSINSQQIPVIGGAGPVTPARPAASFDSSSLWVHGVTFGLELSF